MDLVDQRADEPSLGLVALENFGFIAETPVALDGLDDALSPLRLLRSGVGV